MSHLGERRGGVLIQLDLDHFKTFNDRFGHTVGDTVLTGVADRLRAALPAKGFLARTSGDEFAVQLDDVSPDRGAEIAAELLAAVRAPMTIAGAPRVITASAGVARTPRREVHHALALADRCTLQAKATGRDRVVREDQLSDARTGRRDLAVMVQQLQEQRDELALLSVTDQLTGLPNRRGFEAGVLEVHVRAERDRRRYSVVYMDLDKFHDLNRERGDAAGDTALRICAGALQRACRDGDVVYRKGGEELVALLVDTGRDGAMALAERMRLAVVEAGIPCTDAPGADVVTISGGVSSYDPAHPSSVDAVVAAANRGMIEAKDQGRNRMVYAAPARSA